MFNEESKNRYIEEKQKDIILAKGYLENCFRKSAEFEEKYDKDISNFTAYEIADFYKTLNIVSFDSLYILNSTYSQYTNWCINNNTVVDFQNHFLEFTREKLSTYINKVAIKNSIVTRKQVLGWCEELPNASDQFVLLGLFEGMGGKSYCELINAEFSQINIQENTIYLCTGRKIHISEHLIEISRESDTAEIYYAITHSMEKKVKLNPSIYILKDYPNTNEGVSEWQKGRRIYNKLYRSFAFLGVDKWMTGNALSTSGQIDMVKRESKRLNISPKEYVYGDHFKEMCEQYNKRPVRSVFWQKYGDLFDEAN